MESTPKMNPEVKTLWVEALRSKEYYQYRSALRSSGGYCCLGVLCDVHAKTFNNKWVAGSYLRSTLLLPTEVMNWSGLSASGRNAPVSCVLADMNDNEGKSFAQIADFIEENL